MENNENIELIRRHVDIIILKPLLERDCYGYEILKSIEENSNGLYSLKQPTLYNCLKRLESQKKITSYLGDFSNGAQRRYYSLTDFGRQFVYHYQKQWEYTRTILSRLISDKEFNKFKDVPPFNASDLRPLTKRIKNVDVNEFKDEYENYLNIQNNLEDQPNIEDSQPIFDFKQENSTTDNIVTTDIQNNFDIDLQNDTDNKECMETSTSQYEEAIEIDNNINEINKQNIVNETFETLKNYIQENEFESREQDETTTYAASNNNDYNMETSDEMSDNFQNIENINEHNEKYINEALNIVNNEDKIESHRFEVDEELHANISTLPDETIMTVDSTIEQVDVNDENIIEKPDAVNNEDELVQENDVPTEIDEKFQNIENIDEHNDKYINEALDVVNNEDEIESHRFEVDEEHHAAISNIDKIVEISSDTSTPNNASTIENKQDNKNEENIKQESKKFNTYEDKVDYYQRQFINLGIKKQNQNTQVNNQKPEVKNQEKYEPEIVIDWSKYTPEERLFKRDEIIKKEIELAKKDKLTNKNSFSSSKKLYD